MDLSRQLIGRCAVLDRERDDVRVDLTGFIRRLILFDTYILQSIRLKELPHLLRVFGYDGLVTFLMSDALKIYCDDATLGQIGQSTAVKWRVQKGLLPLGSYAFVVIRQAYWQSFISKCLSVFDTIDTLTPDQRDRLKDIVKSSLIIPPDNFGMSSLTQLKMDLTNNAPAIKTLVMRTLRDKLGITVSPDDFSIKLHRIDNSDFRAESDIATHFGLSQLDAHKIIERDLLALGGLNQRIEEMQTYSAISGFLSDDVPVFSEKLDFLVESLSPRTQEKRFQRVINIKGIPQLDNIDEHTNLNADKLLEIRNSAECREFRAWLSSIDSASDSEIREKVTSLQAKFSALAHTKPGTSIRFLFTTGIGVIPGVGNILGPGLSILDRFLLEKVLPYSGPTTFINAMYPSIFKRD